VIEITFPVEIITVHHALLHVLRRSGYNLATGSVADPRLPDLLNASLPEIHRQLGPITLRNALQTLAGEPWVLVEDPVLRLVSFELKPAYRGDDADE
jgi:type IV pili sensor histidine kinase/response regulator